MPGGLLMPRRKVRKVGKSCRNSSKRSTMSTTPKGFDGSLNHACMGDANGNHWNKRWIIDQFFKLVSKIESMNVHVHAWDKIKLIKATRIHNIEIKWAEDLKQCLLNGCFLSHGQFSLPTSVRQFPASNVDCYVNLYIYIDVLFRVALPNCKWSCRSFWTLNPTACSAMVTGRQCIDTVVKRLLAMSVPKVSCL